MNTFKFGHTYKNELIFAISGDIFEHNLMVTQDMFYRLAEQRQRGREEAEARQRESIERGLRIHMEALELKREEYDRAQRESIKRYVEERDELTRRRWDEQKGYQHGF